MTSAPVATMPRPMRPTHFLATERPCPVCGASFLAKRAWSQFCSDRCRKSFHRNIRTSGVTYDIRATLTRIEAKVDQLLARLP